jgi:tRNA dimethylallyltransferase
MGPTASGKTDLALELCRHFPFELISVDSAQVYRGMNIGAAKPSEAVLQEFPHHLIDIRDPWESYSAGEFCRDVVQLIGEIEGRKHIPLLVGGTMLYFQALQRGLADLPEADEELRVQLDERAAEQGWPALHAELAELDPAIAARLRPSDAQRIQRALEVCLVSGEAMSSLLESTQPPLVADFLNIGLIPADRQRLHERIAARFDAMLADGFAAEVDRLLQLPGMNPGAPALRAVGYRQLVDYLTGAGTLEEAREKGIVATRRLAKRQLTWLRSWPDLHVVESLDPGSDRLAGGLIADWLQGRATP